MKKAAGELLTSDFAPLRAVDGYYPLEDYGLIGDGATAALVGRDGAISWMCVPSFDSSPVFCGILDAQRGGTFLVAPENIVSARQGYVPDSGVLVTEMRSPTGVVRVTDGLLFRSGADLNEDTPAARGELLRCVEVSEGQVRLRIDVSPRGGATSERRGDGVRIACQTRPDLDLWLFASIPLKGLRAVREMRAGEQCSLTLRWCKGPSRHHPGTPDDALQATLESWRRWLSRFTYDGPQAALVRRSAITLKLLDHIENGAMVAAPTSSLPEAIGGPRNWDYRYT